MHLHKTIRQLVNKIINQWILCFSSASTSNPEMCSTKLKQIRDKFNLHRLTVFYTQNISLCNY